MSSERRATHRLETICLVRVESAEYGAAHYVARNVSQGGLFVETKEPLPLNTPLRIWFSCSQSNTRIAAIGEVKHHFFLHYGADDAPKALIGMGIRFTGFEDRSERTVDLALRRVRATCH